MPRYETKVIGDFQTGLLTAREPWLAPDDAFPTLLDARIDNGVLKKRLGFTELADTGEGYPIMGIHPAMQLGHPVYLVADTHYLYKYDPYAESLTALTDDVFTGLDMDFFWFQDWRDQTYLCQGVDRPYVYHRLAGTCAALDTIGDADTDIQIESCRMIFRYKGRLLFVGPVVDGKYYQRRLYHTDVNTCYMASDSYVNGDIEDTPMSGCYINGVPTIFGHEGFISRIKYTFNTDAPFSWAEVSDEGGSLGPFQAPKFNRAAIQVGHARLFAWDGFRRLPLGPQIRDFVDELSRMRAWYMQATVRRDRHIMYLAYPNDGSDENDRILEYNFDNDTFAIHRISAHTLHAGTGHFTPKAEDIDAVFGADGTIPNFHDIHPLRHPDYGAFTLLGGHTGKLFLMNHGTDDDGTAISPEVWSKAFNPYARPPKPRKCRLGRVRILVSTDASETCTVKFYKDLSTTEYKSATLAADGSGDKHWVTLFADGEVANFHRLSFTGGLPEIHAVALDVAPAGALDAGGAESEISIDATSAGTTLWRWLQNDDGELELQKNIAGVWTKCAKWDR